MAADKNHYMVRLLGTHSPGGDYQRIGLWGWLGLYASGAVLLFLVLTHVGILHFGTYDPLSIKTTQKALGSPFIRTVELSLLLFVLIHGLMGFRRIILDLEILQKRGNRWLSLCLVVLGFTLFTWGLFIFNRLSSG
jgi:succinate dehydrogenase hydrophobic anchor subunit